MERTWHGRQNKTMCLCMSHINTVPREWTITNSCWITTIICNFHSRYVFSDIKYNALIHSLPIAQAHYFMKSSVEFDEHPPIGYIYGCQSIPCRWYFIHATAEAKLHTQLRTSKFFKVTEWTWRVVTTGKPLRATLAYQTRMPQRHVRRPKTEKHGQETASCQTKQIATIWKVEMTTRQEDFGAMSETLNANAQKSVLCISLDKYTDVNHAQHSTAV